MTNAGRARRPGVLRYGIEAPYVPIGLAAGAVVSVVLAWAIPKARGWWLAVAVLMAAQTAIFVHTTLRGKLRIWDRELDRLHLRGDERLLDLGCGRGAVLIAAAQRLPRGVAEGVDLWRSKDQSGNDIETATANVEAAGVADRVRLHTADMTALPFEDGVFDVVTSALAIHNIARPQDRALAVREALRVLAPGGRLVLVDIQHLRDYEEALGDDVIDVRRRGLGPGYWYAGPWMAAGLLIATKPAG